MLYVITDPPYTLEQNPTPTNKQDRELRSAALSGPRPGR